MFQRKVGIMPLETTCHNNQGSFFFFLGCFVLQSQGKDISVLTLIY